MKGRLGKTFKIAEPSSDEEDAGETADDFDNVVVKERTESKKWYNDSVTIETTAVEEIKYPQLEALRKEAQSILDGAVALNSNKPPKTIPDSDFKWIKTVMANGTKSDKVAASVILIQDSPLHNLNLINNLIGMVKVGKKEWLLAAETLQELFLSDLLPPNRKLRLFSQQPLKELKKLSAGNETKRKNILLYWYFESQLKAAYRDFVVALNQIAHDTVDANKEKAISILFKLLVNNPEQESALLSNIVNKLGDQSHKVGSKVIYVLTKLLQVHPNMREVVMDEVEKLIFRTNISKRAQYYSVCFLSQFCLSINDAELAKKLINVYLCLFKACIKMGEIDSRMMSALLTGVNRAYPFTKGDAAIILEQINTLYKVVHFGKPSVAIQALSLLYLMTGESGSVSDRFYMVLYKKVSEPRLYNSTHHAMFLSLIFKALKRDKKVARVAAFLKRLLQVASYLPAPIVCGVLFLISEIISTKKNVLIVEHESKTEMATGKYNSDDDDDDDSEHYEDVPLESGDEEPISKKRSVIKKKEDATGGKPEPLKVWRNPETAPEDRKQVITEYDPFHRNPLYAGGDKTVLLELHKLANHYHPSVSLFATNILNGERIRYSGDPIQDFALIRFLDKFSFKNPKNLKPNSEEKETFTKFGRRKLYSHLIVSRLKGNKQDYLQQAERNVPADEKFIFSYLKDRESKFPKKKDEEDEDSDIESVKSEEFEDMIYNMTGGKDGDVDFLNEAGQLPEKEKVKSKKGESDSDDEEAEEEDMSDGDSFAEDFDGDEIEDDISDEAMEGSELDESEIPPSLMYLNEKYKKDKKKAGKGGKDFSKSKLFASAEEFSELLEQTDYRAGGSQAVSNKDNAGVKQLKWEEKRGFKRKYQGKPSRNSVKKSNQKMKKRRF